MIVPAEFTLRQKRLKSVGMPKEHSQKAVLYGKLLASSTIRAHHERGEAPEELPNPDQQGSRGLQHRRLILEDSTEIYYSEVLAKDKDSSMGKQ